MEQTDSQEGEEDGAMNWRESSLSGEGGRSGILGDHAGKLHSELGLEGGQEVRGEACG